MSYQLSRWPSWRSSPSIVSMSASSFSSSSGCGGSPGRARRAWRAAPCRCWSATCGARRAARAPPARCRAAASDPSRRRSARSSARSSARRRAAAWRSSSSEALAARHDRPAQPGGDDGREEPQARGTAPPPAARRGARPRPATRTTSAISGLAAISARKSRAPLRAREPGGARRRRRRGLPLEQPALRDHEPHQRQHDGVHHLVGVVGQERDQEQHLRAGGLELLAAAIAQEHPERLLRARAAERGAAGRDRAGTPGRRRARRVHTHGEPGSTIHAATSATSVPAPPGCGAGCRGSSSGDERQRVALEPAPRRHQREQPEQDLPVAAHPAVLAPRVGEHARREVVHHLDVRDQRRRACRPSNRSCESIAFSGTRPSSAAMNASTS